MIDEELYISNKETWRMEDVESLSSTKGLQKFDEII
jgi:hypothetical protein